MKLIPLLILVVTEWPEGAEHVWQDSDGEIRFSGVAGCTSDFFPGVGVADEVKAATKGMVAFCPDIEGPAGRALMVTQAEWQEARDATG
jgi:hypothetical protein